MDHLEKIKKLDQVYSSELNEVLIKTPPQLFRYAIVIFATSLSIMMILSFIIEYEKNIQLEYVMYESERNKGMEILFFADSNLKNKLDVQSLSLHTSKSILPGSDQKIPFHADSLSINHLYKVNGKFQILKEKELATLSEINSTDVQYKYTLFSSDQLLKNNFEEFRIGQISIPIGKVKLYKMFFS